MSPTAKNAARRNEIKRRLREISRDQSAPGAASEAQSLRAEYRRLVSAGRTPAPSRPVAPPTVREEEAAAIATWPPELRNRVQGVAASRVITPWRS